MGCGKIIMLLFVAMSVLFILRDIVGGLGLCGTAGETGRVNSLFWLWFCRRDKGGRQSRLRPCSCDGISHPLL